MVAGELPAFHNQGVEMRFVSGRTNHVGPATVWFRLRCPVVLGEDPSPWERAAAVADFGNGVSAELDFVSSSFINPDLTVSVHRPPVGEWVCLDARTRFGSPGIGAAESELWDTEGRIGRADPEPGGGGPIMTDVPTSSSTGPSVAELLVARAEDEHPGLRFEDQQWSWREVVSASASRAAWIRTVAGPGPLHIGVLLGNVPEYVFWLGAAALADAVIVGINSTRRGEALAGDIVRTDCTVVITDATGAGLLDGLDVGVPAERVIRVDGPAYAEALGAHDGADCRAVVAVHGPAPAAPLSCCCSRRAPPAHPRRCGARRVGWPPSPCGRPGPTASIATTWPTAPCRCSTATR